MSDDHILLSEILEDHAIPTHALIRGVGRGRSTVYRYLAGEATIPSIVWRWLYSRTRDGRILDLIAGEADRFVVEIPRPAKLDTPTLKSLIAQRQLEINVESEILGILADGVVDANDRNRMAQYREDFPKLLRCQCQIKAAIDAAYEAAINRQYEETTRG